MYRYKRIALGLAAVALFVLAVTGVAALIGPPESVDAIQGSRRDWAAAIQAVSTVVVMGATIVYAAITYRMMQAMKQQTATMLATPTRAHVTELARYLMDWMTAVRVLKWSVRPDWRSPVDRMAEQDEAVQRVGDANSMLVGFGSACPPEVHAFIEPVNDAANAAVGLVELVRKSISEAALEALRGERDLERRLLATDDLFRRRLYGPDPGSAIDLPSESHPLDPSWDDVQEEYLLHVRNDAPGRPEWDDIISGKWYDDVLSAWMALVSACTVFLREKQEAK